LFVILVAGPSGPADVRVRESRRRPHRSPGVQELRRNLESFKRSDGTDADHAGAVMEIVSEFLLIL